MRFYYKSLLIIIFLAFNLSQAVFGKGYVANWVDFSSNVLPIFRPHEALSGSKNGTVSSKDRKITLEVESNKEFGRIVWYKVSASSDPKGWATCRVAIPESALGKTIGVRFHLICPKETRIRFDAYKGVNGPNFYEAYVVGYVEHTFPAGRSAFDFYFKDAGVEKPETVQGFGIINCEDYRIPSQIGFSKLELIFASKNDAAEFELAPIRLTTEILKARGIDLRRQVGKIPNEELDRRCWRGFHLSAMGEQISYWRLLLKSLKLKDNESQKLDKQRKSLIRKIEQGKLDDAELNKLQVSVDIFINKCKQTIPVDKRRWYLGADNRFHYPDGRPFRMFAPYPFRLDLPNKNKRMIIPWDIRYLAGLGFNGIRLSIQWHTLEQKQGKFEKWYIAELKEIVRECERYGMAVSVDLHFGRPEWFLKGKPGMECTNDVALNYASAYHWPEAIAASWGSLAKEFKDLPNTVAWEVPVNEPTVVAGKYGISAYPSLVKSWNSFLKKTYGTRDKLKQAWNCAENPEVYGLKDDESWDNNSIRWMIVEDNPDIQANYMKNPRLWDHLRWVAHLQSTVTEQIMQEIRKYVPGAVGMMHRTIGDNWDGCPVPIDYTSIETIRGKHVCPGTHYGIAGLSAIRAASQTQASYDTEQHVRNADKALTEHVKLGLGICPFWFSQYGYPHELMLADDYGHLQPDTAYLSIKADWFRNYWPKDDIETMKPSIAVILSTRLEAVRQGKLGELLGILKELGCRVGVFNGLEVVMRPELIKKYDAVITPSSYMDVDLIRVLHEKYNGKVLLYGSLERDALARSPENGLAAELVRRRLFIKDASIKRLKTDVSEKIDLSGEWDFFHTKGEVDIKLPPPTGPIPSDWIKMPVPSYWDNSGFLPFTAGKRVIGDAWYRKDIVIPAEWKDRAYSLVFGAIDDYDWVYFNGKLIGCTDERVGSAWVMSRTYNIPAELVRLGEKNEIAVLVRNVAVDGGIYSGPVELVAETKWTLKGAEFDGRQVTPGPQASFIPKEKILPEAKIMATAESPDATTAASVRQGRWYWWISDAPWKGNEVDKLVIKKIIYATD